MRFRLQFSLRMLLLLMALLAVGLAIFRWPWEETTIRGTDTSTIPYRRGWNWQPLRHGRIRTVNNLTGVTTYEADYVDDRLLRARFYDPSGTLLKEEFNLWDRGEVKTRDYSRLAKHGFILETARSATRQRAEWRTPGGKLLESHAGDLNADQELANTEWNGAAVAEEMNHLLAGLPTDRERSIWLTPPDWSRTPAAFMGDQTFEISISKPEDRVPFCSGNRGSGRVMFDEIWMPHRTLIGLTAPAPPTQPAVYYLLPLAHHRNCTLRLRFGVVTVLPISAELLDADQTGALAVEFPAGSTQQKEWLEPVVHMRQDIVPHAKRIEQFFADTSIEVDASRVKLPAEYRPNLDDATYLRPRRDVLGTFLLTSNYRVEQQGNRLILHPRGP
jgi:hypothetical protein